MQFLVYEWCICLPMASEDLFTRFVEPGRVCTVEYGPDCDKVATIVDIINQNRILIDGPTTGVARQSIPIRWLKLSDVVVKGVCRGCRSSTLKGLLEEQKAIESFNETAHGKKRRVLQFRSQMTDFERFKLMVAHKRRRTVMRKGLRK